MTAPPPTRPVTSTLPVLMYHAVPEGSPGASPASPAPGPSVNDLMVPLWEFRAHLEALREDGYEVTGLTRALDLRSADPRRRVVALTFDDAYADFLGAAATMAELGCGGTLYVPTAHVGSAGGMIPGAGRLLTWDELATLPADVVEIGSHSHHHRPLDVLPSGTLRSELETSRAALRDRLGADARSFCFPHGYTSRRVRAALLAAGYTNACIVGRRLAIRTDDVYAVPRVQVRPGTTPAGLRALLRDGEPGLVPRVKHYAQPAWRLVRATSLHVLRRELT